jgi:hypothetical protein
VFSEWVYLNNKILSNIFVSCVCFDERKTGGVPSDPPSGSSRRKRQVAEEGTTANPSKSTEILQGDKSLEMPRNEELAKDRSEEILKPRYSSEEVKKKFSSEELVEELDPWKKERRVLNGLGFCLTKYNEAKLHLGYGC